MKCVCTARCQYQGIRRPGDILDLTELELAIPNVKASFRPVKTEEETRNKKDEEPLKTNGKPLPPHAQMTTEQLRQSLISKGVVIPDGTDRQGLFVLLQKTLEPTTKRD